MRTKEYDVWFDDQNGRLNIVRLSDGCVVASAEIPAEANAAVLATLAERHTQEERTTSVAQAPKPEPVKRTRTPKKKPE